MITTPKYLFLILVCALTICACQDDDLITNQRGSKWKIKYISTVGSLEYKDQKLSRIASEELYYDDLNRLSSIREYNNNTNIRQLLDGNGQILRSDTIIETTFIKYKLHWHSTKLMQRELDSFLYCEKVNRETETKTSFINHPLSTFGYDDYKIIKTEGNNFLRDYLVKRTFQYNNDGNLIRIHSWFNEPNTWPPPLGLRIDEMIQEFSDFDNNSNPFCTFSDELMLNSRHLLNFKKSVNNPRNEDISILSYGNWIELNSIYTYQYNGDGLPTKITRNGGQGPQDCIEIVYD